METSGGRKKKYLAESHMEAQKSGSTSPSVQYELVGKKKKSWGSSHHATLK